LSRSNRWVRIAEIIPWERLEEKYAKQFCDDNGSPATPFRMALGTLIIKQMKGCSDDDVLVEITENAYMQFLIGLHEFTETPPFSQSSVTNFRKYITAEMMNEVNEIIFGTGNDSDETNKSDKGDESGSDAETSEVEAPENKGILLLDATCAPANIAYPTDVNLLNEAREKLEGMVDALFPRGYNGLKPRTYRLKARKAYLSFVKQRKPNKKAIRKAVGQQLRFVKRDIGHVDRMIDKFGIDGLNQRQQEWLSTIKALYTQQRQMYDTKKNTVENRIVSIGQPHVRPIVRGKARASTEFGAKISVSMFEGYAFVDKIGWDAYNEEALLIPVIERYKERYGCYPEAVLVDKIYRNRENRKFCKERGIRISGPRLGRPPKETDKSVLRQARSDSARRNAIEGKSGEGKTGYGLGRVMANLKETAETVIAMAFFCLNISKRLRDFLLQFLKKIFCYYFNGFYCKFIFIKVYG
jgi:hypothetical protein